MLFVYGVQGGDVLCVDPVPLSLDRSASGALRSNLSLDPVVLI